MEEIIPTGPDSTRYFRHSRGLLEVAKCDGSETLVIGCVRVTGGGKLRVRSLAEFDEIKDWSSGFGLAVDKASFDALKAECFGEKKATSGKATKSANEVRTAAGGGEAPEA